MCLTTQCSCVIESYRRDKLDFNACCSADYSDNIKHLLFCGKDITEKKCSKTVKGIETVFTSVLLFITKTNNNSPTAKIFEAVQESNKRSEFMLPRNSNLKYPKNYPLVDYIIFPVLTPLLLFWQKGACCNRKTSVTSKRSVCPTITRWWVYKRKGPGTLFQVVFETAE
jgi:hypothetical protein